MNGSTEFPTAAIRKTWGFKFYILSLFFLGYMALNWIQLHPFEYTGPLGRNLMPANSAAGLTVMQGIAEFSGQATPPAEDGTAAGMISALCLYFVILPVAFLYLRDLTRRRKEEGKPWSPRIFSGSVAVAFLGILFPCVIAGTMYATMSIYPVLKRDMGASAYESASMITAGDAAFRLREFAIRSAASGGGGGTFLKSDGPVTLADVGVQEQSRSGRLILVPQRSDTVLQLFFIGTKQFSSTSMTKNEPGGTVILEATISPSMQRIVAIR